MTKDVGFSERMRSRRIEMGISQRDLGRQTGISPPQLSRYEAGGSSPRPDIAAKIAKALKVNLEWLITGQGETHQLQDTTKDISRSFSNSFKINFSGANLSNSNLTNLYLADVNFSGTDLSGANLTDTNMTGSDFNGANLSNTILNGAIFIKANLANACLKNADIRRLAAGNSTHIHVLQTTSQLIVYTSDIMAVGEYQFPLLDWFNANSAIEQKLGKETLEWWRKNKGWLETAIEANPAEPTQKPPKP